MNRIIRILGLVSLLLAAGCGGAQGTGGTGTEAGNGMWVLALDTAGRPVAGAAIEVRDSIDPEGKVVVRAATDPDGRARIGVPPGGRWSILVRSGATAFWTVAGDSARVVDTLRATTRLAGVVRGGEAVQGSITALGRRFDCGPDGFFQIESLPSGRIPVTIAGMGTGTVELAPGTPSMVLSEASNVPAEWVSLPADTLIPWSRRALPATIPDGAAPSDGAFSMGLRFWRAGTDSLVRLISWSDGAGGGLEVGWNGPDTFQLKIGARTYRIPGIPLSIGEEQVGIAWTGTHLQVYRDADLVVDLATTALSDRSGWPAPVIGTSGVAKADWLAFKRGAAIPDWLVRLYRL